MDKYIKRDDVLALAREYYSQGMKEEAVPVRAIKNIPSVDVAEVKRGVWVLDDQKQIITHCSNCNWLNVHYTWSYCPNCGARMGGEVVKQDQGYYYVNGIDLTEHLQCSDNH